MTIKQILITSLLLSLLVVSGAFIPDTAKAQTETEPADNFQLQTYLTEEQALDLVFPECDEIVEDGFRTYIGKRDGSIQGYAIITDEIGKFHPFTFVVGVDMEGEITNIAVLVYRESRGGEIARKRFLYQFLGKSFKNPIRINKDIINITGATMSVQYVCAGVRKVLAVINEYYLSGKRSVSDVTVAQSHGITPVKEESTTRANRSQNTKNKENNPPFSPPSQGGDRGGEESISDIKLLKQTRMIMGTFAEVSIYSHDEETAGKAIEGALDEMERMDR